MKSLRGEKSPSEESRTSLTLLGSPLTLFGSAVWGELAITFEHSIFTFEAVPGNDISVSLNGEKSWDDMESLLDRPGDGECRT